MEIGIDTESKIVIPPKQKVSPIEQSSKTIPFDTYHTAGGIFDEHDYSIFKDAIEKNSEFQPIHIEQAKKLARNFNLLDPDKVVVTASAYAVLREAEARAPSLGQWAKSNSDQDLFAEALLATQGKAAYDTYTKGLPHIFKTKK